MSVGACLMCRWRLFHRIIIIINNVGKTLRVSGVILSLFRLLFFFVRHVMLQLWRSPMSLQQKQRVVIHEQSTSTAFMKTLVDTAYSSSEGFVCDVFEVDHDVVVHNKNSCFWSFSCYLRPEMEHDKLIYSFPAAAGVWRDHQ